MNEKIFMNFQTQEKLFTAKQIKRKEIYLLFVLLNKKMTIDKR